MSDVNKKSILNNLIFEIKNFGIIDNSKIELNQINIIGGANAAGKSTSSKLLYSFLTSFSEEGKLLANNSIHDRLSFLIYLVDKFYLKEDQKDIEKELKSLSNQLAPENYKDIIEKLFDIHKNKIKDTDDRIDKKIKSTKEIININESDKKYKFILMEILLSEFEPDSFNKNSNINFSVNFGEKTFQYSLTSKKNNIEINTKKDKTISILPEIIPEVIYIDSLSILTSHSERTILPSHKETFFNLPFHIQSLLEKLTSKKKFDVYEDKFSQNFSDLKEYLANLINGTVEFDFEDNEFVYKTSSHNYSMSNTASGIKQIGILQILLNKNVFKEDSFVFIDEPEVNLHPEWQINLAEFIVQLSKKSNITFYINSHSPFFIEAIEVYSKYYGMIDKTNFYLTEEIENSFCINKIETEQLYKIYTNLGDPFNTLNHIRFKHHKEKKLRKM